MQLVILDGYTLNPHDLDWSPITSLAETTIHERTEAHQIMERAHHADIILTNKVPLSADTIAQLPKLKAIFVMATGYNIVDIDAAKAHNIVVCNVRGYGANSVAQHTFSMLLALENQTALYAQAVQQGAWTRAQDFCFYLQPSTELAGKTIGIVGFGQIGQAVARIALGFDINVIALPKHPERDAMPNVKFVDEQTIFQQSDVLTLHCPLTPENAQFICAESLAKMKPNAYLLNTARGGLIHEQDLADALNAGKIAGAGLDVLSTEPPSPDNPLLKAKNCLITPHIAWSAREARQRLLLILANNILAFLNGAPQNVVS
jgi:glycerate dehydrogenase